LSDEALEAAVVDYQDVSARKAELQKEIDQFEEEQNQRQEAANGAGEQFEAETRDWQEIEYADFLAQEQKFVVCLDTMGQDRAFTDEQKRFVLKVVQKFRENWERAEKASLVADRDRKIA